METTAKAVYQERQAEILELVEELQARLAFHSARADRDPANWGFAGDLGHVRDTLAELLEGFTPPAVTVPDRLSCDACGADESSFADHATIAGRVVCSACGATIVQEEPAAPSDLDLFDEVDAADRRAKEAWAPAPARGSTPADAGALAAREEDAARQTSGGWIREGEEAGRRTAAEDLRYRGRPIATEDARRELGLAFAVAAEIPTRAREYYLAGFVRGYARTVLESAKESE